MKKSVIFTQAIVVGSLLATVGCGASADAGSPEQGADETGEAVQALTTTKFTATYSGYSWGSCSSTKNITGYEPSDAGTYPVFVFLTGTSMPFDGSVDENLIQYMGANGFVAATVQYDTSTYPASCSTAQGKASCIYNRSSSSSAISKLCSRAKADCTNKGIYVSGFSQGANLSSMAANYSANMRAAYLIGNGDVAGGLYNLSGCLDKSHLTFATSQLREVDGEADQFFGSNQSGVQSQLQKVTGKNCTAGTYNCLNSDGSGWYIVKNSELSDGSADHCYYYNGANSTCSSWNGWDNGWNMGSLPWQKIQDLAWLMSK